LLTLRRVNRKFCDCIDELIINGQFTKFNFYFQRSCFVIVILLRLSTKSNQNKNIQNRINFIFSTLRIIYREFYNRNILKK
jgi:putative component of toxin-antitoxin plasmid stabilization module